MSYKEECPSCGSEQNDLFLEETNGRFICSNCNKEFISNKIKTMSNEMLIIAGYVKVLKSTPNKQISIDKQPPIVNGNITTIPADKYILSREAQMFLCALKKVLKSYTLAIADVINVGTKSLKNKSISQLSESEILYFLNEIFINRDELNGHIFDKLIRSGRLVELLERLVELQ